MDNAGNNRGCSGDLYLVNIRVMKSQLNDF